MEDELDENDSTLSLDAVLECLTSQLQTRQILSSIPPHVAQNYPSMASGRLLFLLPRFESIHDGECLDEPVLCPMAVAFQQYQQQRNPAEPEIYWYQFQQREPDQVILQQSTAPAKEAGDIPEAPVFAIFQLDGTGELLALAQWDYRD